MTKCTPEEIILEMVRLRESGCTNAEIAVELKRSAKSIDCIIARHNHRVMQSLRLRNSLRPHVQPEEGDDTNLRTALEALGRRRAQMATFGGAQSFTLDGVRVPSYRIYEAARQVGWRPERITFAPDRDAPTAPQGRGI